MSFFLANFCLQRSSDKKLGGREESYGACPFSFFVLELSQELNVVIISKYQPLVDL